MDEALSAIRLWTVALLFLFLLLGFFTRQLAETGASRTADAVAEAAASELEALMKEYCETTKPDPNNPDPSNQDRVCDHATDVRPHWNCELDVEETAGAQKRVRFRRHAEQAGVVAGFARLAVQPSLVGVRLDVDSWGCNVRSTVEVGALGSRVGFLNATGTSCVRIRPPSDPLAGTAYGNRPLGCEGIVHFDLTTKS